MSERETSEKKGAKAMSTEEFTRSLEIWASQIEAPGRSWCKDTRGMHPRRGRRSLPQVPLPGLALATPAPKEWELMLASIPPW